MSALFCCLFRLTFSRFITQFSLNAGSICHFRSTTRFEEASGVHRMMDTDGPMVIVVHTSLCSASLQLKNTNNKLPFMPGRPTVWNSGSVYDCTEALFVTAMPQNWQCCYIPVKSFILSLKNLSHLKNASNYFHYRVTITSLSLGSNAILSDTLDSGNRSYLQAMTVSRSVSLLVFRTFQEQHVAHMDRTVDSREVEEARYLAQSLRCRRLRKKSDQALPVSSRFTACLRERVLFCPLPRSLKGEQ